MNNTVSIFQIYFDDNSRKHLDPAFIPYHNSRKDGYFENSVIKELYNQYSDGADAPAYIGTTSWKHKMKTGVDGHEIISHILKDRELGIEKDVYLFPPVSNVVFKNEGPVPPQYEYNGIIRQEDLWSIHKKYRPDAYRADEGLDKSGVLPFKLLDGQWCFSTSNYWVAKKEVFDKYCETVLLPAMQWFEIPSVKTLNGGAGFEHSSGQTHPIYSFVLEATFGAFLAHNNYSYSYICKKKTGRRRYSKINILGFDSTGDNPVTSMVPGYKLEDKRIPTPPPPQILSPQKDSEGIAIRLQRFDTNEVDCASDRIRGVWIAKNSENKIEIYAPRTKRRKVVIFHYPSEAIRIDGDIKILDICDPVWKRDQSKFLDLIRYIHAVIVPTEGLKQDLLKLINKKIYVIGDGHDAEHYNHLPKSQHKEIAKEIVWFGYAENAHCLLPYMEAIKNNNLKLKVISQRQNEFPLTIADKFVKWDVKTYLREISTSDFAILPVYNKNKSNNKEITSLLCGIPVAKTVHDIERFMSPEERAAEMESRKNDLPKYDAKNMAAEYLRVINEIESSLVTQPPVSYQPKNNISIYSAITGKYEKIRNDIKVFQDSPDDKFRIANMNAKIYKVLAHKFIEAKYSIWVDGNIMVMVDGSKIIDELLTDADIAVFKHPFRNCLFKEHPEARKRLEPEFFKLINEQVLHYGREGMPENFGLGECGMIIRRHSDVVIEFNEKWWAEICRYTQRDQMSFPYVWWKMKDRIKIKLINGNVREHPYFKYLPR